MTSYRCYGLLLLLCCLYPVTVLAGSDSAPSSGHMHAEAETRLMAVLDLARQGNYDNAIDDLSDLIDARPNFRLAQLVYGELMVARTGRRVTPSINAQIQDQREALLDEAKSRWAHRMTTATDGQVPDVILQLAPEYDHVIVADLDNNRLYLFNNQSGTPHLLNDFYATIGRGGAGKQVEGDMRTPIGIYHVARYINDASLPERYGIGALPVNYPNAWDRMQGHTGHGIWLHGVPRTTYSRTPRASEGCVVIANDDFETLHERVDIGKTPVIMTAGLNWVPVSRIESKRAALLAAIEDWRHQWQTIDTNAYLAYYAPDFVSDAGRDKQAFAAYKARINAAKTRIAVDLSQISIFRYPGEDKLFKVTFDQDYDSNNYSADDSKTQYWRQNNDGQWRIVLETEAD